MEWSGAQRPGWFMKFDISGKKLKKTFGVNLKVFHRLHQQNKLWGIFVHFCIKGL